MTLSLRILEDIAKQTFELEMKRIQVLSMSMYDAEPISPLGKCLNDQNKIKIKILNLEMDMLRRQIEYLRSQLPDTTL